ncbi:hypothetical protein BW686_01470 [Pseudomonas syringae]|uniref:Protein kinase domain-containing protein n=1 Tax=Pseudomonas syringae TaxID=317 RepID=A0A244EZL4_PSESX|nr:AAA domain-containing protein [Pseudomonas syringae]OUM09390.1 hypothetical protein BW686_01470 [Pseudomonas syringae]
MEELQKDLLQSGYEIYDSFLFEAEPNSGQPNLISAEKNGEPYLIKYWPRTPDVNDDDLEDIWLHELRQLHRLKGYPGVGDYVSSLVDSGKGVNGFYLVLDTQGRLPLSNILERTAVLKLKPHWLKRLRTPDMRIVFWENILRVVKAIELLHAQGLLHRHLDSNSLLSQSESNDNLIDFQLTGFEWSIRVPTLTTAPIGISVDNNSSTIYSFATDWADLGMLIANLLNLAIDKVQDLSGSVGDLVESTGLMLSEIGMIRALVGIMPMQANNPHSALNGDLIERTTKAIIESLKNITNKKPQVYDLAININPDAKSIRAPFPIFFLVQQKYKEKHGVTISNDQTDEVKKFIYQDLSDNPTLLFSTTQNKAEKRLLIKGKQLIYQVESFLVNPKTQEYTWEIGTCQKGYLEPAHWMYQEKTTIDLRSEQIKLYTVPEARHLYRTAPGDLSQTTWNTVYAKFDEDTDSKTPEQRSLIQGLAACHLTEISYARAEIFPVEILEKVMVEDGTWKIKFASIRSPDAEALSHSMGLEAPAARLEKKLIKNEGEFETITWSLVGNSFLAKEDENETVITFQEYETTVEDQLIYVFNSRTAPANFKQYFIAPESLQGTFRQLGRRAKALDTLETHAELMNVLIHPQQNLLTTQDSVPENETYQKLDESKQAAFKKILRTLPMYLVQGPPGVGKTHLVTSLIKQVFEQEPDGRVLLTAQSHSTVQHLYHEIDTALSSQSYASTRDELLIIRCSKQDKDDENETSDADIKAKEYLGRLLASDLFKRSKSSEVKSSIIKMLDGVKSKRYPLINQLLRSANMVFSTTNSEQVERMIRDKAQFDWSIMEETGKVTGIELLSPLLLSHRRLMIGDHKQLPPYRSTETRAILSDVEKLRTVLQESEQISNSRIKGEAVKSMLDEAFPTDEKIREMGVSAMRNLMLFETLVKDEQGETAAYQAAFGSTTSRKAIGSMLSVQHRMHPDIADIISEVFYSGGLETDRQKIDHFLSVPNPRPFSFTSPSELKSSAAVVWIDMPDVQTTKTMKEGDSLPRWHNKKEAEVVVEILKRLRASNGVERKPKLAILSPYAEQVNRLTKALTKQDPASRFLSNLDAFSKPDDHQSFCSTVDGFQGSEADIVVVSLVRNNDKGSLRSALGFLVDERRMNVLLSRARYQLVIVGSLQFIRAWAEKINATQNVPEHKNSEFLIRLVAKLKQYESNGKLAVVPWQSIYTTGVRDIQNKASKNATLIKELTTSRRNKPKDGR